MDAIEIIIARAGKENAVTREELIALTGMNDSHIRLQIEAAREKGIVICSTHTAKGYYIPKNQDEFEEFIQNYTGPGLKRLQIAQKQRMAYYGRNQIRMEA